MRPRGSKRSQPSAMIQHSGVGRLHHCNVVPWEVTWAPASQSAAYISGGFVAMATTNELDEILSQLGREAESTLPKRDEGAAAFAIRFRPDGGGRSLGELPWHLARSRCLQRGLKGGFSWHELTLRARWRWRGIRSRSQGSRVAIRDILWDFIIGHGVHHRGQLSLMCRLAGGQAPGLWSVRIREEMARCGRRRRDKRRRKFV